MPNAAANKISLEPADPCDGAAGDTVRAARHECGFNGPRFRKISLTDFRSYQSIDLELDGRPATFAGSNGAGKTNLLEALSLFGPGRGLRSARLEELPRIEGPGGWAVSARLEERGEETRLGVGATAEVQTKRVCRIDEASASGPSAFAAHLRMLWLTPAQDRLFMEGAGERRRFLDRMTLAHNADHARMNSVFEKSMRQRQRLLDENSRDDAWLDALEAPMAEAAVAIAAGRREMAGALAASEIEAGDENAAFPAADIALEGTLEAALQYAPAAEVEENYLAALKDGRRADAHAGRALHGPHRSDLLVTHRAKARPARLCSTGEQKALLIGLVLANAKALARRVGPDGERGVPLVLLLDEIAAHLDEDRRAALFDVLDETGFQTFMTGTDQSLFSAWGSRAQRFAVADGGVTEV